MMEKIKQNSESGDNSQSLQIGSITVGVSYSEARKIALDVFDANLLKLANEASVLAAQRAKEFTGELIDSLQNRGKFSLDEVRNPGFQFALFEAQKSYAKTGDEDMRGVLIDVLIDRVQHSERNLRQITLEESLAVIPRLLPSQLDILTIVFLLKRTHNTSVSNFDSLKEYLQVHIIPFIDNLSKDDSIYGHLESAGCGSISIMESSIESIFKNVYRGLFFQGFDEGLFKSTIGEVAEYSDLLTACLNDKEKFQLNAINQEVLEKKLLEISAPDEAVQKIKNLFNQHIQSDELIKDKLIELGGDFMEKLFDVWNTSSLKHMLLTPVGIAIAQANFRRRTGIALDLSIWIK